MDQVGIRQVILFDKDISWADTKVKSSDDKVFDKSINYTNAQRRTEELQREVSEMP